MRIIPRILCVSDHEVTLDMLSVLLSDYEVSIAGSYASALRLIESSLFDLYVIDNSLTDGSGIELCKHIHKTDPNTPVLFYTAASHNGDYEEAIMAGAQGYMVKPVDYFRLLDTGASLMLQAKLASFRARVAECEAIRDHIDEYIKMIEENLNETSKLVLKLKALESFIEAGGTRAHFERLWPAVLRAAICETLRPISSGSNS